MVTCTYMCVDIIYDLLCSLAVGAYFVHDDKYNSVEKDGEEDG